MKVAFTSISTCASRSFGLSSLYYGRPRCILVHVEKSNTSLTLPEASVMDNLTNDQLFVDSAKFLSLDCVSILNKQCTQRAENI